MTNLPMTFSVFTKPWKTPLPELARFVGELGFDGVELPVRPGFQVEPHHINRDLPLAVSQFAERGVRITSVATEPSAAAITACAKHGIPLIRVMAPIDSDGYRATEARIQHHFATLLPLLRDSGVKIGVQNHNGDYVCNATGLRHLLEPFDPGLIGAVWDAAHNALNGENPDLALDIIWPHLMMVNWKNAFWRRVTGPEASDVAWEPYWTTGRQGLASWPRVAQILRERGYSGVLCLTAEYTDETAVDRLIAEDLAYARSLIDPSTAA